MDLPALFIVRPVCPGIEESLDKSMGGVVRCREDHETNEPASARPTGEQEKEMRFLRKIKFFLTPSG